MATGSPRARHLFVLAQVMIDHQPHPDRRRVPARRAQRAEMRTLGRFLVDVKELRVEAHGERLDILGGEGVAADFVFVADAHVLEELHAAAPGVRRPNIKGALSDITRFAAAL